MCNILSISGMMWYMFILKMITTISLVFNIHLHIYKIFHSYDENFPDLLRNFQIFKTVLLTIITMCTLHPMICLSYN